MAIWHIDPDHSVAAFNVMHMMIVHVRGQYNRLSGSVHFDPADRSSLALAVTIDAASLYTGIAQRDQHLCSPDFFDVPTYPVISFQSTGFKAARDGGRLAGDLTIHGVTKPIALDIKLSGPVLSPEAMGGETTIGITASASINREDFNMAWNVPLDDAGVVVGREIWIDLDIEADLEE